MSSPTFIRLDTPDHRVQWVRLDRVLAVEEGRSETLLHVEGLDMLLSTGLDIADVEALLSRYVGAEFR